MYFKNPRLNAQFLTQGFVVIDAIPAEKIDVLHQLYLTYFESNRPGFYSSSFIENETERDQINQTIQSILSEEIESICEPFQSLGACFLTKNPGKEGEMPPHQDWTIVDEPAVHAVTIWIPLQDVDSSNGALQVIPGSHLFSKALRSPTLEDPFKNLQEDIKKDLVTIPLKKGQVIAFSHGLIHASQANTTDQVRIAATFGFVPKNAQLYFYHKNEAQLLEKYQIEADFFQRYNTQIGQAPHWLKPIDVFEYNPIFETIENYTYQKSTYSISKAMQDYKMIPILKEETQQRFFEENGYVVLPVLNETQVEELRTYYFSSPIAAEKHDGFHVSMDNQDKEFCRKTRDFVWGVALPEMEKHLIDFKPFVASFTAKEPSPKGIVPPHQDWSFADKEVEGYCSITCWIALVDTTMDNGALGVIPGTHKLMQNHRPSPSPQTPVPLAKHMFALFPYTQLIEMKAGEMLMFDNRTFHASPPNISNETRLAVGIGITQKNAQLVHYYLSPDGNKNKLMKYKVDESFFLAYDNARLSSMYASNQVVEGYGTPNELPYLFDDWDTPTMIEAITKKGAKINQPLKERMEKLFPEIYAKRQESVSEQNTIDDVDTRTFFQKYTPVNIYREIKCKLGMK